MKMSELYCALLCNTIVHNYVYTDMSSFTFFNIGKRSKLQTKPLYCVPPHPRYVGKHTLGMVGHIMWVLFAIYSSFQ